MILNSCILTVLLHSGIAHAWNLRIDYFKRANNDAAIDSVNIAFVNTSQNTLGMDHAVIPTVNDRGDFAKIKENLNNFAMARRNKYISTPNFDYTKKTNHYDIQNVDTESIEVADVKTKRQFEDTEIRDNTEILDNYGRTNEDIIKKLLFNSAQEDFKEILDSVEKHAAKNATAPTTTTTPKVSTFVALVDETEVRKALQNNPFVRRILKLAKKKNLKQFD